jgi:uncharacterized protein (DUF2235 family)
MSMHVICLDGTGQQRPQPHPTNISLIFDALGGTVVDGGNGSWESTQSQNGGVVQTAKYLPGVGTQGNLILQALGKGFGAGIAEQIVRAYTYLSRSVAPGDDVIITGFSRGAAAARALAGFVAGQGLLDPATYDPSVKDEAYLRAIAAWYQYRAGQPNLARQESLTEISNDTGEAIPVLTPADYVPVNRIAAVGVFDTVSSVGVPQPDDTGWLGYDFNIANTELDPKVATGFHALSADEVRAVFVATYWTPRAGITQVIFPGNHSNVGGGYPETGLSDRALEWMLEQLGGQGLSYDIHCLQRALAPNPVDIARSEAGDLPWVFLPWAPRDFPKDLFTGEPVFGVDASIGQRWGQPVTVLTANSTGNYQSSGTLGGAPLHP